MVAVHECGIDRPSRPPYFADVALSAFQMTRFLKESHHGCTFDEDKSVIMAINEWIGEQNQNFFCEGVKHCSKDEKSVLISERIVFKSN